MELRWYQREAVDALCVHLHNSKTHPVVEAATGAGKSVIIAEFIKRQVREIPDIRIMMVTHQAELILQNYQALVRHAPGLNVGIYSAGVGKRNIGTQILCCGVQSTYNKVDVLGAYDLVIVDECHLIPNDSATMYGKLIEDMHAKAPWCRVIGLTATPFRTGSGRLDENHAIFDEIIYSIDVSTLIDDGWLTPLIAKRTDLQIDVSDVKRSGGDFQQKALEDAVDRDEITEAAVREMIALGTERKSWLIFCAGVDHAAHVAAILRDNGISAASLDGTMDKGSRARTISDFKSGKIRALTNMQVLTTGFDFPGIDLLAFLRPTQSPGLYLQMAGRGLRTVWPVGFDPNKATAEERREAIASGPKRNCLVLDFAGNVRRHGPVDDVTIRPKGARSMEAGGGEAPQKICPECQSVMAVGRRECLDCGHEFEVEDKPKHEATAYSGAILRSREGAEDKRDTFWQAVQKVEYELWRKPGKTTTIRATYWIPDHPLVNEWFSFDGGWRRKTEKLWAKIAPAGIPLPATAEAAINILADCAPIKQIAVQKDGKYWNVRGHMTTGGFDTVDVYRKCPSCNAMLAGADQCSCGGKRQEPEWGDEIPF